MRRLFFVGTTITVAILSALGCGHSGNSETIVQVTKARFIKQADAVCSKIREEREVAFAAWKRAKETAGRVTEADYDEAIKEIAIPSIEREVQEIRALPKPPAYEEEIERMIVILLKETKVLANNGASGIDIGTAPHYEREATRFGLKVCRNA